VYNIGICEAVLKGGRIEEIVEIFDSWRKVVVSGEDRLKQLVNETLQRHLYSTSLMAIIIYCVKYSQTKTQLFHSD